MENQEEKKRPLDIPINTSDKPDYIQGVGKKEVSIIMAALLISVIAAVITNFISHNNMISIGVAVVIITGVISSVVRDSTNESFVDKFLFMIRFYKSQKIFLYKQYFFEGRIEGVNESDHDSK